jgi:hypothetical protein
MAGRDDGGQGLDGEIGGAEEGEAHGRGLAARGGQGNFGPSVAVEPLDDRHERRRAVMRGLLMVSMLGAALALGACSQAEQKDTANDAQAAARDVGAEARDAARDAAQAAQSAMDDAGQAVKEGAEEAKDATRDAADKAKAATNDAADQTRDAADDARR